MRRREAPGHGNSLQFSSASEDSATCHPPLLDVRSVTDRRPPGRGGEGNMDSAQALAVVRSLANGVDPESGEVFPAESAYQRPQIVRALYEAASALERIDRFDRRRSQLPPKTGEPSNAARSLRSSSSLHGSPRSTRGAR